MNKGDRVRHVLTGETVTIKSVYHNAVTGQDVYQVQNQQSVLFRATEAELDEVRPPKPRRRRGRRPEEHMGAEESMEDRI